MYFPVINEWRCDTEGYLISWNVYDYSPEGYLLTERHFGSYEVEMYDTIISDQIEIMTYHYDEAGRMIQQFHGYQYDDYNDHDIHYAKVTTNYWYNERGRRIRTEETDRRFVVRDPLKGLDDDNLIQQSEQITRSDCVITENDKTGGWKSLETFTFTGEDAVYNGQTVEMEYDADGKLLSRTKHVPLYNEVDTARYKYDEKGRPVSAHIQSMYGYSRITVEYNGDSHMVRKSVHADSDIIDKPFAFEIQCEYDDLGRMTKRLRGFGGDTDCIEIVTYRHDGTAVKNHIDMGWDEDKYRLVNGETVYSEPDKNGNYQMLLKYFLNGEDGNYYQSVQREYGEAIPSGVKYGTAGLRADEERVSPVQHNFELGSMANEYLFYDTEETDELYDLF